MAQNADRRISIRRAAELLYRTDRPDARQIHRVQELIATGELEGDSRATTLPAVADLISRASLERQQAASGKPNQQRPQRDHADARKVYQESLKGYFLAVFLRRKTHQAGKAFQRAVVAGQVFVVCAIAVLLLSSVRAIFPPQAPERVATINWLEENTDRYRIVKFHPTTTNDAGQARLWVEYHYTTPQGRGIDTRRLFTVQGSQVVAVDTEE